MANSIGNLAIYGLFTAWYIARQNEEPQDSHEDSLSNTPRQRHQRHLASLRRRIDELEEQHAKKDAAFQRANAWAESRKVHEDVQRECGRPGGWFDWFGASTGG